MEISESAVASTLSKARRDIEELLEESLNEVKGDKKATIKSALSLAVLPQVLEWDSARHFGNEVVSKLAATSLKSAETTTFNSTILSLTSKTLVSLTVFTCLTLGILVGVLNYVGMNQAPEQVSAEVENVFPGNKEIRFSGGDCSCGHINPSFIYFTYEGEDKPDISWQIIDWNNKSVENGNGEKVEKVVKRLYDEKKDGKYTVRFFLKGESNQEVKVKRKFEIETGKIRNSEHNDNI